MTQKTLIGMRAVLKRNAITQSELARKVGVSQVTVWAWGEGRYAPRSETLLRIVAFLRQYEPRLEADDLFARGGRAA